MSINANTRITPQPEKAPSSDYQLLLNRLDKAPLNEDGNTFVRKALKEPQWLSRIDDRAMLFVANIAQQHGLIKESLTIYTALNSRFPDCEEGWQQHLEILNLMGRQEELIRVRAMAAACLPAVTMKNLPRALLPADNIQGVEREETVTGPFQELRREEEQVALFMRLFQGREDAFARQWVNRQENKQGYVPMRRPMQAGDIREHLAGHRTYGIYLLDQDSRVHTGVIDIDLISRLRDRKQAAKERASIRRETLYLLKRLSTLAEDAGLCCIAEVSGGKGYHLWFPVREPVPAAVMRRVLIQLTGKIEEDVSCFTLEIFPKQDHLTGKGFGNLVKLPLGIHRSSGKPSTLIMAKDRSQSCQFDYLAQIEATEAQTMLRLATDLGKTSGQLLIHPRHAARAAKYPELVTLEQRCSMLGQIMATLQSAKELSIREEKIILGTLGHLPRARLLLHHLFAHLPEYSRPLLDYKISRVRGTVLGCKRIHSLLEQGSDLPCDFAGKGYPHPLRHVEGFSDEIQPKSEKVENLQDAIMCLKTAIVQVERYF